MFFIKKRSEQKFYPSAAIERTERLIGNWKGSFEQLNPFNKSEFIKTKFEIIFTKKGKVFGGTGNFISVDGVTVTILLSNGMFDGNILKIDYQNIKKYIFQRGTVVIEMDAKGEKISGKFVGITPTNNEITSGDVEAVKTA
jgi:hypothetical protein